MKPYKHIFLVVLMMAGLIISTQPLFARSPLYTLTAQPNSSSPEKTIDIYSSKAGRINDQLVISMSDIPDDRISSSGNWENVSPKGYYHRIKITLVDWPHGPGEYAIDWFAYEINDQTAVFNYGWGPGSLMGQVGITSISTDGRKVSGHFNITNQHQGHFVGSFETR